MKSIHRRIFHFHRHEHNRIGWMREIILGGQDGLVNVLGIVLGISAATNDSRVLIAASLAAALAESLSMAAVAYTSTLAQVDHFKKEEAEERAEIELNPEKEKEEVRKLYEKKGFTGNLLENIVETITKDKKMWLNIMVKEELSQGNINPSTVIKMSFIVGLASVIASFIPIIPFIFFSKSLAIIMALFLSGGALFILGAIEAKTYIGSWLRNGMQLMSIGMGAAFIGFIIGKIFKVD